MIDLKTYQEKKAAGLVSIVKTDPSLDNPERVIYAVYIKKWDPDTGKELPSEVVGVDKKELEDRILSLEEEIIQIDSFLKDAEKK